MIAFIRNTFLKLEWDEQNPLLRQRAQALLFLLFTSFIALLVALPLVQLYSIISGESLTEVVNPIASALITVGALYLLLRRGYYYTAARGLVLLGILLAYSQMTLGLEHHTSTATAVFPVLASGLLLTWRSTLLTMVLMILAGTFVGISQGFSTIIQPWLTLVFTLNAVALQLYFFVSRVQSPAQSLAAEVQQFQSITQMHLLPPSIHDEQQVYGHVLRLLVDELQHTVAQVYIADENGEVRQRMGAGFYLGGLDVREDVELSRSSGIYMAIQTRETVVLDEQASPRLRRHLLPGIQSGIAVPLVYEGSVLGVLDVQQSQQTSLRETDIRVVELIGRQLSLVIGQLRAIEELRFDLEQQQRTLAQQNMKLLRYEQNMQRTTLDSWSSYLRQRGVNFMGFDLLNAELSPELQMQIPEGLERDLEAGEITIVQEGDRQRVNVPILLNNHLLGALAFTLPPGQETFDTRHRELVQGIVQRLALALENKRLFEQSQSAAERERLANAIGGTLLSATDVQVMLEMAAEEFKEALGAVQARISIQPESSEAVEEPS